MNFEFDNFTIMIDISGNKLATPALLISNVANWVKNKIHVINYSEENIQNYFSIDDTKSTVFIENTKHIIDKLIFVESPVKKIDWISEYIDGLSSNDFLILNGAEKLLSYKSTTPILKADYFDLKTQMHLTNEDNWSGLACELDLIYGKYQDSIQGLITNIFTDSLCSEIILNELEESNNMSIMISDFPDRNNDYENLQRNIITKISSMNLSDSLVEIDLYKDKLGEKAYIYFCAMAYYNHGDFTNSINILDSNYNNLFNEAKLLLADMLTVRSNRLRAAEILNELYTTDIYLKDLFPAILRLYSSSSDYDEHIKWLNIALSIDPENPGIIELNANRLINEKRNDLAAVEFRKLSFMLNKPYYELIARINEIIFDNQMSNYDIETYIKDFIDSNHELKNEAYYRLANYFIEYKDSYFMAYEMIKKCDLENSSPLAVDLIKLKIEILSDDKIASKALKNLKIHSKENDAKKLSYERVNELIRCIDILSTENNGYLYWRKYIDNTQSTIVWKNSINTILLTSISQLSAMDVKSLTQNSWILQQCNSELLDNFVLAFNENPSDIIPNMIQILRQLKTGNNQSQTLFKDLDELTDTMNTFAELADDNKFRLLWRYYVSIIASLNGEHQFSNDLALGILDYYNRVDSDLKSLCLYLGMIAWGNSQYRLGRHIEGIACIISSAKYIETTNEITPFLEEGLNILGRYLADEIGYIDTNSRVFECWSKFHDKFGYKNLAFRHIWGMFSQEYDTIINCLVENIEKAECIDVDWAGYVVNLVAAYVKSGDMDNAVKCINRYYKKAIPELIIRKDVRYEILESWAQIIFSKSKTLDEFLLAIELVELADNDIDDKRKVSHKEERASIGASADNLYRLYIQICSILLELEDIHSFVRVAVTEKIERVLPKISPRAILEQKDYNINRAISKEAKDLKLQLEIAQEEYNSIFTRNSYDTNLLSKKAEVVQSITKQLKKIHPHYMELKEYSNTKLKDICNHLSDDEIFFQYIITPICIVNVIVSSSNVTISPRLINNSDSDLIKLGIEFSKLAQGSKYKPDRDINLENISEKISSLLTSTLFEYVSINEVKKIYCMPDFKLGMFPIAAAKVENKFLIDIVDSIVNIVDYRVLISDKKKSTIIKASNRIFGKTSDVDLKKIDHWLKHSCNDSLLLFDNDSDDFDNILSIEGINTVALYAHGVSDPNGSVIEGAKGLSGSKKIIRLDGIIDKIRSIDNFILISCSGGSPSYDNVENSTGTWASIFEMFTGNIISCKWDVPTTETIELMTEVYSHALDSKLPLEEALIIAQRKLKDNNNSIKNWAGIEFWIN